MKTENIRNFCIIAHIDHGKSTLADRILEQLSAVDRRKFKDQMLDMMELERERGITIKAVAVRLMYEKSESERYIFHLVDTPGHVDFTYEVSRTLAACEGAILVVDATQGCEAQTISNLYLALENDLEIIPVVNKIDVSSAEPMRVAEEIENIIGIPKEEVIFISAKLGTNVNVLIDEIVKRIPPPKVKNEPLKALIFDASYDTYLGVVVHVRVFSGSIKVSDKIKVMGTNKEYEVLSIGVLTPEPVSLNELKAGEIGYLTANLREIEDTRVGDTITHVDNPAKVPLPGYREVIPLVFAGLYPLDNNDYDALRAALSKLKLNDASLSYVPESSIALGFGFRCGFLGLLHLDIIKERIEREFEVPIVITSPSVEYHVKLKDGSVKVINNPVDLPDPSKIEQIMEPIILARIITPEKYIGGIMELIQEKRGTLIDMEYYDTKSVLLKLHLPLAEIVLDFYDKLKSRSKGYASFDYEFLEFRPDKLKKLDILVNKEVVDAFSCIVHEDKAYQRGRELCEKLKEIIPRHLFAIPIQAAISGKIIARSTVKALRKNVLAKCYGGDVTRKRKLLEKQKEGKKRMKQIGNVDVPRDAFVSILKIK